MTPEVTLVMPVWRPRLEWLYAAVAAALDETACTLELVVVDDGNETLVDSLLETVGDDRLRVVRIGHAGQAAACNTGIAAARGRFVRFVDADDVVEPASTSRLLQRAADDEVITYGSTLVCDEGLNPIRSIVSDVEGDAVEPCLLGRFAVRHESMLFPRRVVEDIAGWEGGFSVSADWDFTLRALERAPVHGDPTPATRYRRHTTSMTGRADVAAGEADRRRIVDRFFERHPERQHTPLEQQAYAALYLDTARAYAHARRPAAAATRFARAARREPIGALRALPRLIRAAVA